MRNVKVDWRRLGLVKDNVHNLDIRRSLTTKNRPTLPECGNEGVILYMDCVLMTCNVNDDEFV